MKVTVKCACGNEEERNNYWQKVTCFECKVTKMRIRTQKQTEERKEARKAMHISEEAKNVI